MNENEVYEEYIVAQAKARAAHKAVTATCNRIKNEKYRAALKKEYAAWMRWVTWRP